jgi:hypothetical protein
MDMETMTRLEHEADMRDQTAAVLEHWKRQNERRRALRFWLSPWQVVDDPVAAVPASEGHHPMLPSDAGTGAAGSRNGGDTEQQVSGETRFPGRPHHL